MDRGSAIHTGIEQYLKGAVSRMSKEHNPAVFGDMLKGIKAKRKKDPGSVFIEETWAYRADWTETRWDDWNHCWVRVKIDVAEVDGTENNVLVALTDWKTGKFRPTDETTYGLQLDLYALSALTRYQESKEVSVIPSLVYIDYGIRHSVGTYTKADLPRLKKEWGKRVAPMLKDTTFAPKPNNLCRFCHFRASNGGPCKY